MNWRDILDLIVEYQQVIWLAAALACAGYEKLHAMFVELMLVAEKMAKDEVEVGGPAKMQAVLNWVNELYLRNMLPEAFIAWLAQFWYDKAMGNK